MKKDIKECLCDNPQCAKCLAGNCQYDNCLVHTDKAKNRYQKIKMTYTQSEKPDEEKINKAFDILFEEVSKMDDEGVK